MSDSHSGLTKLLSKKPIVGAQTLPLAAVPNIHQVPTVMTRLSTAGQGGRVPVRQSTDTSSLMANILSCGQNPRKRKIQTNEDIVSLRRKLHDSQASILQRKQTGYVNSAAFFFFMHETDLALKEYKAYRTKTPQELAHFIKNNKIDSTQVDVDTLQALTPARTKHYRKCIVELSNPIPIENSTPPPPSQPSSRLKGTSTPGQTPDTVSQDEQIVERAKQEAYVMQRVRELQKDGLWAEKRLPKIHEIPRSKAHWDYLLEEMAWLAADFAQERKWKKAAAKKCARMVQKHFLEKEILAQKAVKAQETQLKRVASLMAKEIKQFWGNVEKLVEFKQQTRLEEKRKKALDQHLSFIVDQTEKYSSLVAKSMNTSQPASPTHHSDDEFKPEEPSDDDEETIAKEEAISSTNNEAISEEINMLQRESEMPIEDLLSHYESVRETMDSPVSNDDDEYLASEQEEPDDEDTIHEQEKAEGSVDHEKELNELNEDNDMSIEELKAKYNVKETAMEVDGEGTSGSKDQSENDSDDGSETDEDEYEGSESESESESEEGSDNEHLKSLIKDGSSDVSQGDKDKEINDVAAIAESLQPKGNTLSSTKVVTKIPFLLKHSLREYQHIGLDWLVTMYERNLNGILADEMGLGKTIQTIALIAHLACEKNNWGPHLIIVPTSVMLNWEIEFKKWCPAFKILTYYGTQKERKLKRSGWTKPNAFHICITSYKLVIQDHQSFRRKKWKYLILDEAQNIKNFKSQRWQLLLNFQSQRRLLLTGTPLQNNLMELWSLMHFLMPNVFESHKEFKEWFSNPVTGMIEGNAEYNENIIKRLHKVLRPFLLRRLKSEVETQMPKKYEHIVMCRLSNRQRYLYDDFMSRAKTKETLASGNLLSVINVLMQLRKVCNHPNLFEVRPTVSPFQMEGLTLFVPSLVWGALDYNPFKLINFSSLNLAFAAFEFWVKAFVAHEAKKYKLHPDVIKNIDNAPLDPPPCPKGKIKINMKRRSFAPAVINNRQAIVQLGASNHRIVAPLQPQSTKIGTSPVIKTVNSQAPTGQMTVRLSNASGVPLQNYVQLIQQPGGGVKAISLANNQLFKTADGTTKLLPHITCINTSQGKIVLSPQMGSTVMTTTGQRYTVVKPGGTVAKLVSGQSVTQLTAARPVVRVPPFPTTVQQNCVVAIKSTTAIAQATSNDTTVTQSKPVNSIPSVKTTQITTRQTTQANATVIKEEEKEQDKIVIDLDLKDDSLDQKIKQQRSDKLALIARINDMRCLQMPTYGLDLVESLTLKRRPNRRKNWLCSGYYHCRDSLDFEPSLYWSQTDALRNSIFTVEDRVEQMKDIFARFVIFVPAVSAPRVSVGVPHPAPWKLADERNMELAFNKTVKPKTVLLHPILSNMATLFPDPRLIQYDCGKLQSLDRLLRQLKSGHHRVLIFTQMTRMLDVLEAFLNFHGHIYLRLDGTTKVDQRQVLMERFNADKRIFCFILSTRSGGVGINLTGADTVVFYDSDWNPTMDAQAQDRCHRIGQTRDVHIYRLISDKTVEENILKKANQKRMLGDVAIEGGNFTTAYFKSSTIQDIFNVDTSENDASTRMADVLQKEAPPPGEEKASLGALETALAQAEDDTDVAAAKVAKAEAAADLAEFDETIPIDNQEPEMSKTEIELNKLIGKLSSVERYAMKFVEETESVWSAEQYAAAEAEIEQQKKEWELGHLAAMSEEEHNRQNTDTEIITYSGMDARNQVNSGKNSIKPINNGETHRTRSHGRLSIDLWTLDESPISIKTPVNSHNKITVNSSNKKCKKITNTTTPQASKKRAASPDKQLKPFSNPNLVIRTRRASGITPNNCGAQNKLGKVKRKLDHSNSIG